ncbi:MAG: O-antigen ligase family protein, partial [Proteobacteria bacterium]|nr:O-antigen ligase family protein [Pseudomonadota bacterium]
TGLLRGLSLGLMLQAGYVINQKLHGVVQATGTMYHQNTLGMMTELALLILIAALLAGERATLIKAGIVAGLIVIAGGGSRGAMGIAGGGIVVYTLLSLIRQVTPIKLKMVGLGVLAAVVIVPLGMATLKERFGSESITTQETQRAAFERAARAMAADHPILGVGANMYVPTANLQGYADKAGVAWNFANRSAPVHNAYLLARAETGWAGEFAFLALLIVPIAIGLRFAFRNRNGMSGEIALGAAAAVAVNLLHNNYEFTVFNYEVFALVFVAIGMIAAQVRGATQPMRRRPAPPPAAGLDPGLQLANAAPTIR